MDCRAAKRLIPAFLDGELQPDKEALLNEHLDACGSCRADVIALKQTMTVMGACQDIAPTFTITDIKSRAAERQSLHGWFSLAPRWAAAFGVALAISIGAMGGVGLNAVRQSAQPHSSSGAVSDVLNLGVADDPLVELIAARVPDGSGQEGGK
ncbi:MAG: zf-HC2 domain-containing protein [Armatimonadota bacterium]